MADAKTRAMSQIPLFSHSSARELSFLASRADEVAVSEGRQLTHQGQPADSFYLLLEGEAEVEIDGKHMATLKTGDFFGEISMLDGGPAVATVTTTTASRLMVMSHAQFRDAVRSNDALLGQVMAAMAERLRADGLTRHR